MQGTILERAEDRDLEIVREFIAEKPVSVARLARALGLEVKLASLKPNISGMIRPSETARSGFEIRINKFEIPERQRFTIAHEIGHYLLHKDMIGNGIVDSVMYRSRLSNLLETQANKAAAEIIMPARLVRDDLKMFRSKGAYSEKEILDELSRNYNVSKQAMSIRIGVN